MGSGGGFGKILGTAAGIAAGVATGSPEVGLAVASGASSITAKKPKVASVQATQAAALSGDATAAQSARASLFSTDGGINGQELTPDQVAKRDTILGN